jgi:alkane 1-monooxygenase
VSEVIADRGFEEAAMKTYALSEPVDGRDVWWDGKRYLWTVGLVVPLLPFVAMGLHAWTGWTATLFAGPIIVYGLIPLLDLLGSKDKTNPPEELLERLEEDRYYRWILYAYIPLQYAGFVLGMWYIATQSAGIVGNIGLALSVGICTGFAINTAHELGHKREEHERWLAKVTLAPTAYGHFYVEHNRGHHVRVATPEDPASSKMGESFYRFWPRTVFGSLRSAWHLEAKRLERSGKHPYRLGNECLNAWAITVVLWAALLVWLGVGILPYLVLQAIFGYTLLELVNYMEHYGMRRQKVGVGERERYERVDPTHSWNSNNIATNVLLYHLQRHSDHHANPTRRYQALRDFKEAPVLPTGYAGMMVVALFPPLFRRLMDPLVIEHFDGDLRKANLHPAKAEKLLRRYPPPADVVPDETPRADESIREQQPDVPAARCPGCGYTYEVAAGNEQEGFAAGTAWSEIPDDWTCPDCGVREKVDFIPLSEEPA